MILYQLHTINDFIMFVLKIYLFLFSLSVIIFLLIMTPEFIRRLVTKMNPIAAILFILILFFCFFNRTRNAVLLFILFILFVNSLVMFGSIFQAIFLKVIRRKSKIPDKMDYYPEITIIYPIKNESNIICNSIDKAFEVDYPPEKIKIIVIDDNSTDNTLDVLNNYSKKNKITVYKNDKEPGKASALNNILNNVSTEFLVIMDADHYMSKDFLKKALPYFKNPKVGLVQGMNCIRNGDQSIIAKLVELEYHGLYQVMYYLKPLPAYLGTGAVFKTEVFKMTGMFKNDISTEDLEFSFRIHQNNYEVIYSNKFCTYELATVKLNEFLRQRYRWLRGTWQAVKTQFSNMIVSKNMNFLKKLDFLSTCFFPCILLCSFLINVYYFFGFINVISWPVSMLWLFFINIPYILYYFLGVIFAKKTKMIPVVLLIPLFYALYSIAAFEAMFDEWVINSNYKGIKADRSGSHY